MPTKLNIDLSKGTVDVDGDEELVREIYRDFKEALLNSKATTHGPTATTPAQPAETNNGQGGGKRRRRPTRSNDSQSAKKAGEYTPQFNNELNLKGLAEFFDQYVPE